MTSVTLLFDDDGQRRWFLEQIIIGAKNEGLNITWEGRSRFAANATEVNIDVASSRDFQLWLKHGLGR